MLHYCRDLTIDIKSFILSRLIKFTGSTQKKDAFFLRIPESLVRILGVLTSLHIQIYCIHLKVEQKFDEGKGKRVVITL